MADDFSELGKLISAADAEATRFKTLASKTLADIKSSQAQVKALGASAASLQRHGWLKRATAANADKKILDALKTIESTGSRASCVNAAKLIKAGKNNHKDVTAIGSEIAGLLAKDEALAKSMEKQQAVIKQLRAQAEKLGPVADKLDQQGTALAKQIAGVLKEIKSGG
ncbi:hypothetical protein ACG02S_00160 [Roseateles sp. DC23W]|uniref:Phasin family protein n=1 Tax=Pelomonas dachongensis TaxID=3299029 RepID=A0ABW7EG81_9BURK